PIQPIRISCPASLALWPYPRYPRFLIGGVKIAVSAPFRPRLLLLVGVEDRGDALGIGGEGRDAGALDLQQLADGAVAGAPAAVHRFGQFLIDQIREAHRHADLAPDIDREPDILVPQAQPETARIVLALQELVAEPVEGAHPAGRALAHRRPQLD